MDFLGKVVRDPWCHPAKRMIIACCSHKRLRGRPNYHNKDAMVKNLKLLFVKVNDVVIDDKGRINDWINEASNEKYWNLLVKCLLDKESDLPERPAEWPRRRRSPRNHDSSSNAEQPFPPTPPRASHRDNESPSPPRHS